MNPSANEVTAAARSNLLSETLEKIQPVENAALRARLEQRLNALTPPGSLGRLDQIILQYGLGTDQIEWQPPRKGLFLFCADHGVASESTAHASVTTDQMVRNLAAGGAAASVLCRQYDIDPVIVDMGVNHIFEPSLAVIHRKLGAGTKNFAKEPAISREQAERSIETGIRLARAAHELGFRLLGVGEMAAGGTISAGAVIAAITSCSPSDPAASESQDSQSEIISRALELHHPSADDPLAILAAVGGFEIGGMAGFLLGAAASRIPVCIDGLAGTAAALLAERLAPNLGGYLFSLDTATPSRNQGTLNAHPLLDLEIHSGQGVVAAITIGMVDSALRLYREMASSAAVSPKNP